MAIIDTNGMLNGERMAKLSDAARWMWPFIVGAGNGYCRFRVDYLEILSICFKHFITKPTEEQLASALVEFRDQNLLFIYRAEDGSVWAQWDREPQIATAQRYFDKQDKKSPSPPRASFEAWQESYQERKKSAISERNDSLANHLVSTTSQIPLEFSVKTGTFFGIDKLQTTTTNNKPQTPTCSEGGVGETKPEPVEPEFVDKEPMPEFKRLDAQTWVIFRAAADSVGMLAADSEWFDLETATWPRLSMEERLGAVQGIELRRHGEYRDPGLVHRAKKYLLQKLWTQPIRPQPELKRKPTSIDEAARSYGERMNRELLGKKVGRGNVS